MDEGPTLFSVALGALCVSVLYSFPVAETKLTPIVKQYEKDAFIITQGEDASGVFFYLAKGTALVDVEGRTVGEIKPGEFFGELAAILGTKRTANVIALTSCEVREFRGVNDGTLMQLITANPKVGGLIVETLAKRIKEMNERHGNEIADIKDRLDKLQAGVEGTIAALEKIVGKFQSKAMGEVLDHLKTKTGITTGDDNEIDRAFFKVSAKALED